MQDGAGAVRALAAQQAAGSSKEQEDYVMQCTGCDDRAAAALALQAARGNVDQVTASHSQLIQIMSTCWGKLRPEGFRSKQFR